MNLSNFSLLLTAGLLALTAYLSLQAREDTNAKLDKLSGDIEAAKVSAEEERLKEAAFLKQLEQENLIIADKNRELTSLNGEKDKQLEMLIKEEGVVESGTKPVIEAANPTKPEVQLTEQQKKIRDAVAIAEITQFIPDHSFAVLNAGTTAGLEPNMKFVIRRDYFIVGKLTIDSVPKNDQSVANVDPKTIPEGMEIRKGDSVISFEDAGL